MKKMRTTLLVLITAAVLNSRADQVELTFLQSTDIHGAAAIANLAAWVVQERQHDKDALVIDCGDLCNGSFEAAVDVGASMVAVLNHCKYDVWIPGNHEFRIGGDYFRRNMDLFTSGVVLAANIRFISKGTENTKRGRGKRGR